MFKNEWNHYQVQTILYIFKVSFILQKTLIWFQEKLRKNEMLKAWTLKKNLIL